MQNNCAALHIEIHKKRHQRILEEISDGSYKIIYKHIILKLHLMEF